MMYNYLNYRYAVLFLENHAFIHTVLKNHVTIYFFFLLSLDKMVKIKKGIFSERGVALAVL